MKSSARGTRFASCSGERGSRLWPTKISTSAGAEQGEIVGQATRRTQELAIAWLSAVTALNASGGAWYGLRGAPAVPREWLQGSPFDDYRIPSIVLGTGVGGTCAVAAMTAWRGSRQAPVAAIVAGGALSAWIAAQVAVIGLRSPLQPVMAAAGASLIGLGRRLA